MLSKKRKSPQRSSAKVDGARSTGTALEESRHRFQATNTKRREKRLAVAKLGLVHQRKLAGVSGVDLQDLSATLLGGLSLLKVNIPSIARQLGLVNVDTIIINNPVVNETFITVTGTAQSDAGPEGIDGGGVPRGGSTAVLKWGPEKAPKSEAGDALASTPTEKAEPTPPLPVHLGTYLRFDDPKWWRKAPEIVDVAKSIRVVSIARHRVSVPSISPSTGGKIRIEFEGKSMVISRGAGGKYLHFKDVRLTGRPVVHFQAHAKARSKWSLRRIRANQVKELLLDSSNAVMYYSREFAECVWVLVHRHCYRGDEAYILMWKRGLIDG